MNDIESAALIAVPVAMMRPLVYRIPPELEGRLLAGHRVAVPLGARKAFGFVLKVGPRAAITDLAPDIKLRAIAACDPEPVLLEKPLLDLAQWVSDYYVAPIGMALEAAVPRAIARPPKGMDLEPREPSAVAIAPPGHILNPDQVAAVKSITAALGSREPKTFLLQGVTGSGKTEVYLRAAQAALAAGRGVLILVPEIALGTQIVRWVRERFGDLVAEYHSQLKPAERRRAWWAARTGAARVVVGARSAVFVPIADLSLIIVDEEHEPSYKQGETPRYHGRDTALMRARLQGAVSVLGSATPSLEANANAMRGKYERLLLPARVDDRPQPSVTLIDLRSYTEEAIEEAAGLPVIGAGERDPQEPLSPPLIQALRQVLADGDQAILFLNRRGFSTSVQCRECGHIFECPRCSVVLTHHRAEKRLRCHYCNHSAEEVERCPHCNGANFAFTGVGTQKVEAALAHHIPAARVLRMDQDSTRKRGALPALIAAFEEGAGDILLGTQMVAKGFDFPRVTLVGVINADREMGLPDFRGQERAFQLLTQVAGRAGRGDKPGRVFFQTYLPGHHVIAAAGLQDYPLFAEREMGERELLGYPPHRRMANLLFDGPDEAVVTRRATEESDLLAGSRGIALLGPAPMPLSRLKGQYRWHLTLIGQRAGSLARVLREVIHRDQERKRTRRCRLQVDMDPVSML